MAGASNRDRKTRERPVCPRVSLEADAQGTSTSLTNSAGAQVNSYTYDSFGKLTASTGTVVNPYEYIGREFDSETGLYYYRARYYDPQAGRFINEDPLGFDGDGVNFYSYVTNDPLDWIDLTGEGKGPDRGHTSRPDGTDNPFKKLKPDPDDPTKVIWKDKDGKDHRGPKPPGFDPYWKKKHPDKCESTTKPKEQPKKMDNSEPDYYCRPGERFDCVPRPETRPFWWLPADPIIPARPAVPVPGRIPFPEFGWAY